MVGHSNRGKAIEKFQHREECCTDWNHGRLDYKNGELQYRPLNIIQNELQIKNEISTQEMLVSFKWPNLCNSWNNNKNHSKYNDNSNIRNSVNALHKKLEENKIITSSATAENQGWAQNLKTAKQGTCCVHKNLNTRMTVDSMFEALEVPKEMKQPALTYTQ